MLEAKAYVFDLDGTLVWLPVDWEGARREMKRLTGSTYEFKPVFPTIEKVIAERRGMRDELFAALDRLEVAAVPSVKLNDGSLDVLKRLSRRGKLSLVTLQGAKACTSVLERLGLARFFVRRFTREDSLDRATQVEMAISSMGVGKEDVIFVADRINDLNAANTIGVRFVMIRRDGENPGAGTIYRSMADLSVALA